LDKLGFSYLSFFIVVLVAHRLLQSSHKAQKIFLTLASYYFYMTIDWRFAGLLLSLTLINFAAGYQVVNGRSNFKRRLSVTLAIIGSLGILFYFKYLNFFGGMANALSQWLGSSSLVPFVDVILPVGISFMTFQAITYPIDLYSGRLKQSCNLSDFSLFMAFFPRLLSGPIVRASYFLPQLQKTSPYVADEQRFEGFTLILRGLVKKVLIADTLGAHLVDPAFADPEQFSPAFLCLAMFGYSFQAYLDLSGYTDMAIGAARMLGYKLPINFNRPYLATSISNFWQRWHITMSSFFRDYLYNSLSSAWNAPVYVNLLIVFVAIGLWQGAGWNFVLYGCIHGSLIALEYYSRERRSRAGVVTQAYRGSSLVLRICIVFSVISLTRLLFRGEDLTATMIYLSAMLSSGGDFPLSTSAILALITASLLHFTPIRWRDSFMAYASSRPAWMFSVVFVTIVYTMTALSPEHNGGFIYFQF